MTVDARECAEDCTTNPTPGKPGAPEPPIIS
jgi:hypothetical protein